MAVGESGGGGDSSRARGGHGVEEDGAPDAWDPIVSGRRANVGAAGLGCEAGPALLLGCAEGKEQADAGRQELAASAGARPTGRIGREGRKVFSFSFSNFQTNFVMQIQINLKFDFQTTQYKNNMQQHVHTCR